jgi:hypothetical protein
VVETALLKGLLVDTHRVIPACEGAFSIFCAVDEPVTTAVRHLAIARSKTEISFGLVEISQPVYAPKAASLTGRRLLAGTTGLPTSSGSGSGI